jgi:hypothetical protein
MAQGFEVLSMLRPDGGWVISGNDYENIQWLECEPLTKKDYTDGFAKYDAWKVKDDAAKASAKQAILDRLGITAEEAHLLLS